MTRIAAREYNESKAECRNLTRGETTTNLENARKDATLARDAMSLRRVLFTCTIVVAAALSFSDTASSSASTTIPLKPPVITEPFTRLACTPNTTIGQEGCAETQLLSADRRINREVRLLFSLLTTTSQKRAFIKSEHEWLTYRGADCTSVADVVQGGSFEPVQYALCEVGDDQAKSASLHSFFKLLEQGSSPATAWP